MQEYQNKYNYWLNHEDLDPGLKNELLSMDEKSKEDAFYTDVKFQTAGMRGLMGAGTNRINIHTVRKATMGYINYLKKLTCCRKEVTWHDSTRVQA